MNVPKCNFESKSCQSAHIEPSIGSSIGAYSACAATILIAAGWSGIVASDFHLKLFLLGFNN
jgi:hypothetical protein